jgi:aspartate ammonia-lyase
LTLEKRCVAGITANRDKLRADVENSIGLVTALNPYIGYAAATAVAIEAHATGRGVYELVLEKKLIPAATLAKILQPDQLTTPHGMTIIE